MKKDMENKCLQPMPGWFHSIAHHMVRQWILWLVPYGVQFGVLFLFILGCVLGLGLPIALFVIPFVKSGSWSTLIPALCMVPMIILGLYVGIQLISSWTYAAVTIGISHGPTQAGPLGQTLRDALGVMFKAFWMSLLLSLITTGSIFCLGIPLFVVMPRLWPAWYIAVLEDRSIHESLVHSWHRTRGMCLPILGRMVIALLIIVGVSLAMFAAQIVPFVGIFVLPVQLLVQMLIPVFYMAAGYVVYCGVTPTDSGVEDTARAPTVLLYLLALWGAVGWIVILIGLLYLSRDFPQIETWV
jgi:hypothetical protein